MNQGIKTVISTQIIKPTEVAMVWTMFVVLPMLWLQGMVRSYSLGRSVHMLLAVAMVVVTIRVIQGRMPL